MVGPVAIGAGALLVGAGPAAAQDAPPAPGILKIEIDDEDGTPELEVDYVNLQGERREFSVDLQTWQIEDEPED